MHRQRCWYVLATLFVVMAVGGWGGDRPVFVAQALAAAGWERQPQANAGPDQFISILFEPNPIITLDGRGSTDAEPNDIQWDLAFRWTFTNYPGPVRPILSNPAVLNPTFTPQEVGVYELSLAVKDGRGRMASDAVAVNVQAPTNQASGPCNCRGSKGDVLNLTVQVTDADGRGVPSWPVTFRREEGDGVFVGPSAEEPDIAGVLTDANGSAAAQYMLGGALLQIVAAEAQDVPLQPVTFSINLGPSAGNGTEPVNIAVRGNVVYTANSGTNNVSVLSTAERSVADVISLTGVRTEHGAGAILGVAASAVAKRLYVYGVVPASQGEVIVLLAVDTETNTLTTLLPLTTLPYGSPELASASFGTIVGLDFGNLVTVDEQRRRIYAVVPGVVEGVIMDDRFIPSNIADGELIVIDGQSDAPTIAARVPVGKVPTGVAANARTNRIYVTNRGYFVDNAADDTVTVIDGSNFTALDTITVGHVPLGVKLDEVNDVIYVANLFGKAGLESTGAVSVINGQTNAVIQTIPTRGAIDLAVLVGAETPLLADEVDRLYVGHESSSTVIECNVTDLTVPEPCQGQSDLPGVAGKLAVDESNTLLFGARRYDNAVAVLDLATAAQDEIVTGISIGGLAIDSQTGSIYVSNFLDRSHRLFAIDASSGSRSAINLSSSAPRQVEVDDTIGRIYVVSPTQGVLLALDSETNTQVATMALGSGFDFTAGVDKSKNLLYVSTSGVFQPTFGISPKILVFDGAPLGGTDESDVPLAEVAVGREDNPEYAQGVAVDADRNLIYVARFSDVGRGGDPNRNALVVLQGPDFDELTRVLRRPPQVVAEIPNIGLNFGGGRREIAVDPDRNLIYVVGARGCIVGSDCAVNGAGFGGTDITVLDGFKIVDAQGQVTPNPGEAVIGVIPIKVFPGPTGDPFQPQGDYSSREMAFNLGEGLLYVITRSSVPFIGEGFVSVIDSGLVIDADRNFLNEPHPDVQGALRCSITTIPAGIDPAFIAVDATRDRVVVTNQSLAALLVLPVLSATFP